MYHNTLVPTSTSIINHVKEDCTEIKSGKMIQINNTNL